MVFIFSVFFMITDAYDDDIAGIVNFHVLRTVF